MARTLRSMHPDPSKSVVVPCRVCGRTVTRFRSQVRSDSARFHCSKACRNETYRGDGNPKWRGGRLVDPDGRVRVYAPADPNTPAGSTHVYEYRLIASQMLGRPLHSDEIVHHINGDCTDNRPENLQVMTQGQHIREHGLPARNRRVN